MPASIAPKPRPVISESTYIPLFDILGMDITVITEGEGIKFLRKLGLNKGYYTFTQYIKIEKNM